jgi:hypothetical protein
LIAIARRGGGRWLRWLALILVITATPFLWLVARDIMLVQRAAPGEGQNIARGILVARLIEAIENSSAAQEAREPMRLTMLQDPPCFVVDGAAFRPSDTPPGSLADKGKSLPPPEEVFYVHQSLSERMVRQFSWHKIVWDGFSTTELVLFNACLSATPLAGWCEAKVSDRMNSAYRKTSADVAISLGTKLPRAGEPGQYCYTMPGVVDSGAQP